MSSESDCAWQIAQTYGPEVARLDRAARVAWAQQRIIKLQNEHTNEHEAHKRDCEDCRKGEFCFKSICFTEPQRRRYDDMRWLNTLVELEKRDQEYANRARLHGVVYEHHIDGFSSYWQNVRHRLFVIANHRCQCCGKRKPLEAHHRHYDTLGFEEVCDLQALCRECHEDADCERTYDAGLATFATKKYGEDALENIPLDVLEDEFNDWLEDRDDDDYETEREEKHDSG